MQKTGIPNFYQHTGFFIEVSKIFVWLKYITNVNNRTISDNRIK